MMDIQAALGLHQLERLERNLVRRREIWSRYDRAFSDLPVTLPLGEEEGLRHACHLYTLLLDLDELGASRDEVQRLLHERKIGTGIHYRALHLHKYYRDTLRTRAGELSNAEWISERTLSLPLSAKLSDQDVADVIYEVRRALAH